MRIKKYKSFNESKNKFPNIKTLDIDGFIVYLGRDAKSNDHLTFNMSEPDDIWMHTKGVPGSHMLIVVRENYSGYDICISVFCYELERLKDMINIFDILQYLKTDIIPQYDTEFDMYQTKRTGGTVLEFNFYYNEGNGDDFDNE